MKSLNLTKPHLIIMVGIPGAGKSFFAEHFTDTFKAPIVSSEKMRRELFKLPKFSKEEDLIISKITNCMLDQVLKTNRTIVYVGKTSSETDRAVISKKAREADYEPLFIWVQTEPAAAKKRAIKRTDGLSTITADQFDLSLKKFSTPIHKKNTIVISGKHTYPSQLKIVLKRLAGPQEKTNVTKIPAQHPQRGRNFLIR